ncbi:hypothetical protein LTR48_000640 [Friedmanniomyces endolithicus]|uniref:Uncharacterized protein n=2 Tax=Dothideomycetidae TaxID=451867 RepID=A0A4U0UJC4_9PEZI|nr:hypothetical protein LTS09_002349 [Friedmanniomyces endolithicus]KAK0938992.1 hypothetical protein LTR29_009482 [Friedmanniomyces endolithicus]KAK1089398.1 hypothetical protein LTR48_000640 [Friedmanniomyces endolithicus]KAK5148104.1 hypothetical protein LTR32_000559 [Rachicladosporium monterosium]TKA35694.1 hypothetical protein B0A54_12662 [Friedmanniomyces endolithicus]
MTPSTAKPVQGSAATRPAPQEAYWKWQPEKAFKALQQQNKTEKAKTKLKASDRHALRHQKGPADIVEEGEHKGGPDVSAKDRVAGSSLPKLTNMYEWLRFAPEDPTGGLESSRKKKPDGSRAVKAPCDIESGPVVRGRTRDRALPGEAREVGMTHLTGMPRGGAPAGAIEEAAKDTRASPGPRRFGNFISAADRRANGGKARPAVCPASSKAFDAAVQHWPGLPDTEKVSSATSATSSMARPSGPPMLTFPGSRISGSSNRKIGYLGRAPQATEEPPLKPIAGNGSVPTANVEKGYW